MKNLKIALSLVLTICMLLAVVPMAVFADEPATSGTSGTVDWVYDATAKTITISGNGTNGAGTVPGSLYSSFSSLDYNLIIVEDGITEIAESGLSWCKAVDIILPSSLRTIGNKAFRGCASLKNLTIPEGVTYIGFEIVRESNALEYICYPSTAEASANINSYMITTVNTYKSGQTLKDSLNTRFGGGSGFKIPVYADALNRKADGTFAYGVVADIAAAAVSGDTVYCLRDCTTAPQVADGVNIVYMGAAPASGASGTVGTVDWVYDPDTKTVTISGNGENGTGTVPSGIVAAISSFDYNVIIVKDGITAIADAGLRSCKAVDVILPKTLKSIGTKAFMDCKSLVNVTIPEGVTTIGVCCFENDSAIKHIYLPSTITSIAADAFLKTSQSTMTVYMSDGWTWMDEFKPCKALTYDKGYTTKTADALIRKADGTFEYGSFSALTGTAVSGDTIYCILDYISTSLPHVAEGVEIVYMGAAEIGGTWKKHKWTYDPGTLTVTVTPTNGNTAIGDGYNNSLWSAGQTGNAYGINCKKVIIGEGFTTILKFGLYGCPAEEIIFPSTLESIAQESLQDLAVKSLEFPKGFKSVGAYPFKNLKLDYIYFPSTIETFGGSWWDKLTVGTIYYGNSTVNYNSILSNGYLNAICAKENRIVVNAIKVTADGTKTYGDFKALVNGSVAGDTVTLVDSIYAKTSQYDNNKDEMPTTGAGTIEYYPNVTVSNKFRGAIWTYNPENKSIVMESTDPVSGTSVGKADENYSYPSSAWKKFDYNKLVIGEGIKEIQKAALSYCKATDVSFPSTLKTIGEGAFSDSAIKDVILPVGIESVTNFPFKRCVLNSIYFPSTLKNLNSWYSELKSVEVIYYSQSDLIQNSVITQIGGGVKNAEGGKPEYYMVNASVKNAETEQTGFVNLYSARNDISVNDTVTLLTDFNNTLLLATNLDIYPVNDSISTKGIFYLDTNGDDVVNVLDFVKMKKHLADNSVEINQGNLEYSPYKGSINLIYLTQYILGVDVDVIEDYYPNEDRILTTSSSAGARKEALKSYLEEINGEYTLAGQEYKVSQNPEIAYIYEATGKLPALMGFDMNGAESTTENTGAMNAAMEWSKNSNGIVALMWHWSAPNDVNDLSKGGSVYRKYSEHPEGTEFSLHNAVTAGTDENTYVLNTIDAMAYQLKKFKDAGIPVLWRPLHEASGGWFWWGASAADYKALWSIMYDRMTNYHGLDNLIWVWNGQSSTWMPDTNTFDIAGYDSYSSKDNSAQSSIYDSMKSYTGGKMLALSEVGSMPAESKMKSSGARWLYWCTWYGDYAFSTNNGLLSGSDYNSEAQYKENYLSENVITLDELPLLALGNQRNNPKVIRDINREGHAFGENPQWANDSIKLEFEFGEIVADGDGSRVNIAEGCSGFGVAHFEGWQNNSSATVSVDVPDGKEGTYTAKIYYLCPYATVEAPKSMKLNVNGNASDSWVYFRETVSTGRRYAEFEITLNAGTNVIGFKGADGGHGWVDFDCIELTKNAAS